MINLQLPISEAAIRELKMGDEVAISGLMVTARDAAHKYIHENWPDWLNPIMENSMIYHCGPVVKQHEDGTWSFVAAGPTTSIREEPYEAAVMEHYKVRGVIGKGGMGETTLAGLSKSGGVYLHAIGGLAASLAKSVVKVHDVYMLDELGVPEAFWHIEVKDFPAVVTMDSHGGSLHKSIKAKSDVVAKRLISG
ncbi:MAG: fumarate hydratase C-terminal domain-containing protein [FCB group bacterium]|nr:fumarate hydratase C-terminal domain-containing protein [FCB group bacterium]MBL7028876.1 fumarate hydratase C-terminal domain-containing protein [Candidatus Neomarinimicrobiota bacterium]MBL7122714.1 fumarate hydratase C-terminal domain-containing protein [Candidatus Neomarinimicrobiota bacterium]